MTPGEDVDEVFWAGCAAGDLWLQQCTDCGRHQFYPRYRCTTCWSAQLVWTRASGLGTLASFSVVYRGTDAFADLTPYAVTLVKLAEGPVMMSMMAHVDERELRIDLPLRLEFLDHGGQVLPTFVPTTEPPRAG